MRLEGYLSVCVSVSLCTVACDDMAPARDLTSESDAASAGARNTGDASSVNAGTGGVLEGGGGAGAGGALEGGGGAGAGAGGAPGGGSSGAGGGAGAAGAAAGGGAFAVDAGSTPPANMQCELVWESGFENGFPGEFGSYDGGGWSEDGQMPPGRVSAWTIIDRASGEPVFAGDHAYRGWIVGSAPDSHRPYPGIYENAYPTPLVNTFWVYLDVDYDRLGGDWVHFGTWGNDDGSGNGQWALHTMSVRERKLEFAHTDPFLGEYIGPSPQPDFPLGQWVRFTVYVLYEGTNGFVQAWQDGVPVLRADVSQLAQFPGTSLITAHWGMYAAAGVDQGRQYNDEIRIWTLRAPLADLSTEPLCGD